MDAASTGGRGGLVGARMVWGARTPCGRARAACACAWPALDVAWLMVGLQWQGRSRPGGAVVGRRVCGRGCERLPLWQAATVPQCVEPAPLRPINGDNASVAEADGGGGKSACPGLLRGDPFARG